MADGRMPIVLTTNEQFAGFEFPKHPSHCCDPLLSDVGEKPLRRMWSLREGGALYRCELCGFPYVKER